MTPDERPSSDDHRAADSEEARIPLGPALRRAWVGYQQRLDAEMAAAGFGARRFPDGRVLRLCSRSADLTAAQIGRELGMSRQGAGKIVAQLQNLGYVSLRPSPGDAREKTISLTSHGAGYLAAHRDAARRMQNQIRETLGPQSYQSLRKLLDVLGGQAQPRLRDHLRQAERYPALDGIDAAADHDD